MVAGAPELIHQGILEVPYRCVGKGIEEIFDAPEESPVLCDAGDVEFVVPEMALRASDATQNSAMDLDEFIPTIRSGSSSDIGPRTYMEDEHICIDDLAEHLGSMLRLPAPSAFYGVFDGHGGSDAAAYIKQHAVRFLFEDVNFPQSSNVDEEFSELAEEAIRKAFNLADLALAQDCTVSSFSGTTALTAMVFGRLLIVANAGDCRAILCRNGKAVEMSEDHKPTYESERRRIEKLGGYINDGYLNGVLSVARALGDWDLKKTPTGTPSPLISEPEFRQTTLSEGDEFLIIGCDGIWDVVSSQHAVSIVRKGLRRHDNPERCARELVREALRLNSFDNLTVVVVCFTDEHRSCSSPSPDRQQFRGLRGCRSLSDEAFSNIQNWLDGDGCN